MADIQGYIGTKIDLLTGKWSLNANVDSERGEKDPKGTGLTLNAFKSGIGFGLKGGKKSANNL